jgi:DNA repair exonuclease SbcCD ATPase subunit
LPPQARSQEARNNWESALDSKDRAIAQLEEALQSRQRTLEQLTSSSAASADAGHQLQAAQQRAAALEAALNEAQSKVGSSGWCHALGVVDDVDHASRQQQPRVESGGHA